MLCKGKDLSFFHLHKLIQALFLNFAGNLKDSKFFCKDLMFTCNKNADF